MLSVTKCIAVGKIQYTYLPINNKILLNVYVEYLYRKPSFKNSCKSLKPEEFKISLHLNAKIDFIKENI